VCPCQKAGSVRRRPRRCRPQRLRGLARRPSQAATRGGWRREPRGCLEFGRHRVAPSGAT
jgi:hypothetical protein